MFIIKCSFLISLQQVFQRWYRNVQEHDKRTHMMVPQSSIRHINHDKTFHHIPQTESALRLGCWATTLQKLLKQENHNVVMVEDSSTLYTPGLIQVPHWVPKVRQWGTPPLLQVHWGVTRHLTGPG